mgnify:CR=1 FL=1
MTVRQCGLRGFLVVCRLCRQGFFDFAARCLGRNDPAPPGSRTHNSCSAAAEQLFLTWAPRLCRMCNTASSSATRPPHGCDCGGHGYVFCLCHLHGLLGCLGCSFMASSFVEHDFLVSTHQTMAIVVGHFSFPFRPLSFRVIFFYTFFSVAASRLCLGCGGTAPW